MLTSDQFDKFLQPVTGIYATYTQEVIDDIARRLVSLGEPTATAVWQVNRLNASGLLFEDIIARIAKLTGETEEALSKSFLDAGATAMKFDDSIYAAAGLDPLPLNVSPAMAQVLTAGIRKTGGELANLTLTTAISSQSAFLQAADVAYLQTITGTMSYDQAIRAAVKKVASDGLHVIYPSGHRDSLDVAVRRAVLTGIGQTTGQLQTTRAAEMGADLVQTSEHIGARPSHAEWQGKIFSLSGTSNKYSPFVETTGYGTGAGLGGWNCRHSFYPFFEGISENAYNAATRGKPSAQSPPVTYNGKKQTPYEATQTQRHIERRIRYFKRQASALDAAGLDSTIETAKVRGWQATMRDFVNQTGLNRQSIREQI